MGKDVTASVCQLLHGGACSDMSVHPKACRGLVGESVRDKGMPAQRTLPSSVTGVRNLKEGSSATEGVGQENVHLNTVSYFICFDSVK